MRIVALLAVYNEARFIGPCLEHLFRQGLQAYLIDNCSTDETVALAEPYLGRGLLGIETLPRNGTSNLGGRLRRKEQLAAQLDADWFVHMDADEIRVPPHSYCTMGGAFGAADAAGFNAVNFFEFTFVPTQESPDHDHPRFFETMRSYYPFAPTFPHRLNAWKRQPDRVDLASSGGHTVRFPGIRMFPESFKMRHYQFLSVEHAVRKYVGMRYEPSAVAAGYHGWRALITPEAVKLPSEVELRRYTSDEALDASNPRARHLLEEQVIALVSGGARIVGSAEARGHSC